VPPTRPQTGSPQSVTSAPESRTEDQARRLKHYLVTMGIRTACFVLLVVIDHPVRWVFAFGAVFLPFVAVVAANAVRPRVAGRVRPVLPQVDDTRLLDRDVWREPERGTTGSSGSATDR
jgi:Protein of unknown function (DUF3099)